MMRTTRAERRARAKDATRAAILAAARALAAREGARHLSLRRVAAESGFAPAALYGYFRSKDELLLALAAEELSGVARTMRAVARTATNGDTLPAAASVLVSFLRDAESLAAAGGALRAVPAGSDGERLFNGRLIAMLAALAEAMGRSTRDRNAQGDVILLGAALAGLAMMSRSGRLGVLGFELDELLARLEARFSASL